MPLTLEKLHAAANSLGMTASRTDGVLDVRLRPFAALRIKQRGDGFETETRRGLFSGPVWLGTLRTVLPFVALGFFFGWHRPHRLDGLTLAALVAATIIYSEMAWIAFLSSRTREKLFTRAYEMEQGRA